MSTIAATSNTPAFKSITKDATTQTQSIAEAEAFNASYQLTNLDLFNQKSSEELFMKILENNKLTGKFLYETIHNWEKSGGKEKREIKDIMPKRVTDDIRPAFRKLFLFIGELMFSLLEKEKRKNLYFALIEPLTKLGSEEISSTTGASVAISTEMARLLKSRVNLSMDNEALRQNKQDYIKAVEDQYSKCDSLYFSVPLIKNIDKKNTAHVISSMKAVAKAIKNRRFEGLKISLEKLSFLLAGLFKKIDKNRGTTSAVLEIKKNINSIPDKRNKGAANNILDSLDRLNKNATSKVLEIKKDINSILAPLEECYSNISLLDNTNDIKVSYNKFFSFESIYNKEDNFDLNIPILLSAGTKELFSLMEKNGCPKSAIHMIVAVDTQLKNRYWTIFQQDMVIKPVA